MKLGQSCSSFSRDSSKFFAYDNNVYTGVFKIGFLVDIFFINNWQV